MEVNLLNFFCTVIVFKNNFLTFHFFLLDIFGLKDMRQDLENEDKVMIDYQVHTIHHQYNFPSKPSEVRPVSPRPEVELKIHVDEFGDD
jgi:hypothetical protein